MKLVFIVFGVIVSKILLVFLWYKVVSFVLEGVFINCVLCMFFFVLFKKGFLKWIFFINVLMYFGLFVIIFVMVFVVWVIVEVLLVMIVGNMDVVLKWRWVSVMVFIIVVEGLWLKSILLLLFICVLK